MDPIKRMALSELHDWCEMAPPGTLVPAAAIADLLGQWIERAERHRERPEARHLSPERPPDLPMTWREKIWVVASETRLNAAEVAEALGRPKSFVYARTYPAAEDSIPHRRIGRNLRFVAGEIRDWILVREGHWGSDDA